MKSLPKRANAEYYSESGGYDWDLGQCAFSDITEVSGTRVERLAKAAENGRSKYKKKSGDKTAMGRKHGPV